MESNALADFKGVVRRRRKVFLLTFLPLFLAAVVIAFVLPPVYRAKSTILIEDQQIPEEFVKTTITSYVEERLQMITQQIMSRTKLLEIINQFDLYTDLRERYTTEEIIEKMREAIHLEPISAEVIDRRTGRPSTATIAFDISFEGRSPATVHRVANVLASLYLEENLRTREKMASNTTAFLQAELDGLKTQIDELEARISRFKEANLGMLPEYNSLNLQTMERLTRDLERVNSQMRALQERKIYLEGQLATVDPVIQEPERVIRDPNDPRERLKQLRLELIALQARVSEVHPDVKRLQKEIAEVESEVGALDDTEVKALRLSELKARLAATQGKLGPEHPDVVKLTKEIQVLSRELKDADPARAAVHTRQTATPPQENPAYINLQTQIASTALELKSLAAEARQIKEKIAAYQKRLERAPAVEKEYTALTRDYEHAQRRYNEVLTKLQEAKLAQGMEEGQRGERFTIIDPAQLPEKPYKPNRIALILIGLVLSLGAGVGLAAAQESLDDTVKSVDELAGVTPLPVLSLLPLVDTPEERRARVMKRLLWMAAAGGVVVAALFVVHTYVMPLDILWIRLERRLMITLPL
ncbi:MAG: Wzz/FepE/Etk N-terminal domain-containing protein [Deferrisomatales bacterium]